MKSAPFVFKQFTVAQHNCPMKVNTDGVLLGAWVNCSRATRILDIGTGTGVIALMMAQKNTGALVHAIDINEGAYGQASENFRQSPWSGRLSAFHSSLQLFHNPFQYDLIVSNPPYFANSQQSPHPVKNEARHQVSLNLSDLIQHIARLLSPDGKACLVLPCHRVPKLVEETTTAKLFITAHTEISAVAGKPPYLSLLQLEFAERAYHKQSLAIHQPDNSFTEAYRQLTHNFYLKF